MGTKICADFPKCSFVNGDTIKETRTACLISNNCSIKRFFQNITNSFDKLYSSKAYIHWYIREHMELDDFVQARADLDFFG
mmetsp:Transcript_4063/g.5069  ORF Transcript_4063/g.5069 Transcript_4063/m.5069 type:complete len:81 (+) Transcript_4063:2-244(+)